MLLSSGPKKKSRRRCREGSLHYEKIDNVGIKNRGMIWNSWASSPWNVCAEFWMGGMWLRISWRRLNCAISSSAPSSQSPLLLPVRSLVVLMPVKIYQTCVLLPSFPCELWPTHVLSKQNSVMMRTGWNIPFHSNAMPTPPMSSWSTAKLLTRRWMTPRGRASVQTCVLDDNGVAWSALAVGL